jgi:hypothetical protein
VAWTSSHKSLSARVKNKKKNMRIRTLKIAIMGAALAGAMSASASVVVNFDDLTLTQPYAGGLWDVMPTTYGGLTWQSTGSLAGEAPANWEVTTMAAAFHSAYSTSLSAQSGTQAAYNGGTAGFAQTLSVSDGSFQFNGAYFASWPNSSPSGATSIEVIGLLGGVQQWTLSEGVNSSTWAFLDGTGTSAVNELEIVANSASPYLMDTLTYTPVPEPTTMVAGALLLLPFGASTLRILRRRTA